MSRAEEDAFSPITESESTSSLDTDFENISNTESFRSDDEQALKDIMDEIPVRVLIMKLMDPNDHNSFVYTYANKHIVGPETIIGRRPPEVYVYITEDLMKLYYMVATTGITYDLPDYEYGDQYVKKSLWRCKLVGMPNNHCLIILEDIGYSKDLHKKNVDRKAKVENLIDQLVDGMITSSEVNDDSDWSQLVVKNMLTFVEDESEALEEEMAGKQAVIKSAEISALIKNLATASGKDSEDFIQQFLMSFRYFISPSSLLKKMIFKFSACGDGIGTENAKEAEKKYVIVTKLYRN